MWWQEKSHFLATEWVHFQTLETASWKAFRNQRVRKTRDWLDLSVEHLSTFWKHFHHDQDERDVLAFQTIEASLENYVRNASALYVSEKSAPFSTIAILPFLGSNTTGHNLPEKALAATLASLWQIGIGRGVVVGPTASEEQVARRVFASLNKKMTLRSMELEYIMAANATKRDLKMMPRVALRGLQLAMRGNHSLERQRWLGSGDTDKWKFVYFSEPDLILHARPSAMNALTIIMNEGKTLSGHRFQPVPHQQSFPGYDRPEKVLPHNYSRLIEMDPLSDNQSCCDAGKYYFSNPSNRSKPLRNKLCGWKWLWWQCGFLKKDQNYSDPAVVKELHKSLNYHFYFLKSGTGFPLVDNHQRTCNFRTDGQNCAAGQD